jgi:hypothetical protein
MASVSTSSSTTIGTGNPVVTKPTSLAVGDLMFAQCSAIDSGVNPTYSTPSGWTLLTSNSVVSEKSQYLFYKVADSGDVAASNFTFTCSSASAKTAAGILRIANFSSASVATTSTVTAADTTSGTHTLTGITPLRGNELVILMATSGSQVGFSTATAFSSPAVATSNPGTWTNAWNRTTTTGSASTMFCSYASRPEATATGNATLAYSAGGGVNDTVVHFIVINSDQSQTHTPPTQTNLLSAPQIIIGRPIVFSNNTPTVTNTHITSWTNPDKGTTTWTNPDK